MRKVLALFADAGLDRFAVHVNPIDAMWADRPPPPLRPALPYQLEHAGRGAKEKREQIGELLRENRMQR